MKQFRFLAFGLLIVLGLTATALHEYYVSVTHANYNPETEKLELGIKLFTDDLERTILVNSEEAIKLSDASFGDDADEFFAEYLEKNLLFTQGGKVQELTYVGFEPGPDETWLFAEITMPASGTFEVKHTVLFDVFPEQINIVHFKVNGKEQSHYFNKTQPLKEITL